MRSPAGLAGAVLLLAGVPLAFLAGAVYSGGASEILHLTLAASFLLFAAAVFDFRLPRWMALASSTAIGSLGAIFLLQAVSDLTQSRPLADLAYGGLGQSLERLLGDAFLLWCAAVVLFDSRGVTRLLGVVALTIGIGVEVYRYTADFLGSEASPAFLLLNLPIFVWLLFESRHPPPAGMDVRP
jgi:hypothetical protein